MRLPPWSLNAAVAGLFMVGAACFALGTIPWYVNAVGAVADAVTFFVGSLFFTSASFGQLVQSQSPAMAPRPGRDDRRPGPLVLRAWRPRDSGWLAAAVQFPGTLAFNGSTAFAISQSLTSDEAHKLVWVPDFVGSILFLVASWYGIRALGAAEWWAPRSTPWWIAWLNMVGSIFFMASAIASDVLPNAASEIDPRWANLGTFLGGICFFVGAALMLPAWEAAMNPAPAT